MIDGWGISCEIALILTSLDFTDDQLTLVQVMAWCRQATSHYLSQCWPRSLSPYGITRPQWRIFDCYNSTTLQSALKSWCHVFNGSCFQATRIIPSVVCNVECSRNATIFALLLGIRPKTTSFNQITSCVSRTLQSYFSAWRRGSVSIVKCGYSAVLS